MCSSGGRAITRNIHESIARSRGLRLSERDLDQCIRLTQKVPNPYARENELARIFYEESPSREFLTYWIPACWRYRTESSSLDYGTWLEMLRRCIYTVDFEVADRPNRALTVFRGSTPENRFGLAWTLDISQARYFADRRQGPDCSESALIWVCRVPVERMLARIIRQSWENELVADVRSLEVRPAEPLRWKHRILTHIRRRVIE